MRAYTSKEELKDEIKKTYTKFIAEFDNIPEEMKDLRAEDVDRTPAENLAYKVGWTTLVLKWEQDERNGLEVKTPSDQFKWNQLGELYQWFTDTYAGLSLHELRTKLDTNIQRIYGMIDAMTGEDLFAPHRRKWADGATKSAVARHITSASPKAKSFFSFMYKISFICFYNMLFSRVYIFIEWFSPDMEQ